MSWQGSPHTRAKQASSRDPPEGYPSSISPPPAIRRRGKVAEPDFAAHSWILDRPAAPYEKAIPLSPRDPGQPREFPGRSISPTAPPIELRRERADFVQSPRAPPYSSVWLWANRSSADTEAPNCTVNRNNGAPDAWLPDTSVSPLHSPRAHHTPAPGYAGDRPNPARTGLRHGKPGCIDRSSPGWTRSVPGRRCPEHCKNKRSP